MVPPRGDAPRSSGYLPGALLLSYGGNLAEHQRIALWTPCGRRSGFRDRFLVYAGRAPLKMAPQHGLPSAKQFGFASCCAIAHGFRTMTIGLTGRQAPLLHQGK